MSFSINAPLAASCSSKIYLANIKVNANATKINIRAHLFFMCHKRSTNYFIRRNTQCDNQKAYMYCGVNRDINNNMLQLIHTLMYLSVEKCWRSVIFYEIYTSRKVSLLENVFKCFYDCAPIFWNRYDYYVNNA